jgi:FkbM family methyltransferase
MRLLLQSGLKISTILDVGVQFQTKELRENFVSAKHVLFEPVREYHDEIRRHYAGRDYELFEIALSDETGRANLQVFDITGSGSISHSSLKAGGEAGGRDIASVRLDDFMQTRNYADPYLLKIDVDGNELKILAGAVNTLRQCMCVVVECPISLNDGLFFERAQFLRNQGFSLWDIVDFCYYKDQLSQVDLVFIRNDVKLASYSPWTEGPFDVTRWDTKWQ